MKKKYDFKPWLLVRNIDDTFVTSNYIFGDKFMPPFLVSKLTLWQVWEVWIESAFLEINILHRLEIFRQNQTTQLCNNMIFCTARLWSGCVQKWICYFVSARQPHYNSPISQISWLLKKMTSFTAVWIFAASSTLINWALVFKPHLTLSAFLIFWHYFKCDGICFVAFQKAKVLLTIKNRHMLKYIGYHLTSHVFFFG